MITKLVFSGGSIRGIAYIGCLKALEENNMINYIDGISCTSSGSIFGLLLTLGYNSLELENIMYDLDLDILKDITSEGILQFYYKFGIDTGNNIVKMLKILIKNKMGNENINFKDLYEETGIKLIITGVCVNTRSIEYFSHITHPEMKVYEAVRISVSIPFIFNAYQIEDKYYVDGGIIDNYPIMCFKDNIKETLGFLIEGDHREESIKALDEFIIHLIYTIEDNLEKYQLQGFEDRTIILKTDNNIIDYNLSYDKKKEYIKLGYETTKEWLIQNKAIIHSIEKRNVKRRNSFKL